MRSLIVRASILCVLLAMLAVSAQAYVVFLKDGEQIVTEGPIQVEGEMALLILPGDIRSSLPLSEIDVERTQRENTVRLGNATVFEGLDKIDVLDAKPPPPPRDSISSLIRRRDSRGLRLPEPRKRNAAPEPEEAAEDEEETEPRTPAGYLDLAALERQPYPDREVSDQLGEALRSQGLGTVAIYAGSAEGQPLVMIETANEGSVFKALEESAKTLLQLREGSGGRIDALEVLLLVAVDDPRPNRGGQFLMTPELADVLASGQLSPAAFFVRYVEF